MNDVNGAGAHPRAGGGGAILPRTGPPAGVWLLFASGAEIDYAELQKLINLFPNRPLGPSSWLVILPPETTSVFYGAISMLMPPICEQGHLILAHLSGAAYWDENLGENGAVQLLKQYFLDSRVLPNAAASGAAAHSS